jgi:cell division transport system permease protein
MHALAYAWDEALASLWRGRQSAVLSVVTIALALFVLGGFLIVTVNLERLADAWGGTADLSVYLDDAITEEERAAVERALTASAVVGEVEYVSKQQAAARFRETFADLAGALDTVDDNPLPASYEVGINGTGVAEVGPAEDLASLLRGTAGVADVRFDREWLERLLTAVAVVRGVGLALGTILTLAAALTVANVVRLALYARRSEIQIMDLVGAPPVYVRGPFVMEGVLQGGLGAGLALSSLAGAFVLVRGPYLRPLADAVSLPSIAFLSVELCVLLLLGGMLVGCLGGVVATSGRR